jgi:hypothetical protein
MTLTAFVATRLSGFLRKRVIGLLIFGRIGTRNGPLASLSS